MLALCIMFSRLFYNMYAPLFNELTCNAPVISIPSSLLLSFCLQYQTYQWLYVTMCNNFLIFLYSFTGLSILQEIVVHIYCAYQNVWSHLCRYIHSYTLHFTYVYVCRKIFNWLCSRIGKRRIFLQIG